MFQLILPFQLDLPFEGAPLRGGPGSASLGASRKGGPRAKRPRREPPRRMSLELPLLSLGSVFAGALPLGELCGPRERER